MTRLLEKLEQLPPARQAEVEDFVDFPLTRSGDEELIRAALETSASSFSKVRDNPDDAACDKL